MGVEPRILRGRPAGVCCRASGNHGLRALLAATTDTTRAQFSTAFCASSTADAYWCSSFDLRRRINDLFLLIVGTVALQAILPWRGLSP